MFLCRVQNLGLSSISGKRLKAIALEDEAAEDEVQTRSKEE